MFEDSRLTFKEMEIMKAIKLVLIVFGLVSVLSLSAQTFAEQPSVQMHSTSAMMSSGSELPQAAVTGVSTTYTSNGVGSSYTPTGPQRDGGNRPGDNAEPYPLGDTPWLFMLLLVAGYALRVARKHKLLSCLAIRETR